MKLIDAEGGLTKLGKIVSAVPLELRMSVALVMSFERGFACSKEVLIIGSVIFILFIYKKYNKTYSTIQQQKKLIKSINAIKREVIFITKCILNNKNKKAVRFKRRGFNNTAEYI